MHILFETKLYLAIIVSLKISTTGSSTIYVVNNEFPKLLFTRFRPNNIQ